MTSCTVGMTRRTSACGRRFSPRPSRLNLGASFRAATSLRCSLFLAADFRFPHGGPGLHRCLARLRSAFLLVADMLKPIRPASANHAAPPAALTPPPAGSVLSRARPAAQRSAVREHTLAENGEQMSGLEPDQLQGNHGSLLFSEGDFRGFRFGSLSPIPRGQIFPVQPRKFGF